VDALGVTGYEGLFRKSCELTMHTLRNHNEALLSVLDTLVHDPLCDWLPSQQNAAISEQSIQMHARESLEGVRDRLNGIMVRHLNVFSMHILN